MTCDPPGSIWQHLLPISADLSAGHLDEHQAPQLRRKVVRPATRDLRLGGKELALQAPTSGRLAAAIATTCAIRRLIRAGVERNRKLIRRIEKCLRAGQSRQLPWRRSKNGRSDRHSREPARNSDTASARGADDSGFVVVNKARTKEIFSATEAALSYFGITPKTAAKRSV